MQSDVEKPADAKGAPKLLKTQIADVLENAILAGEYAAGARLTERELVERFKVSSIPVREALQELEARGLVVKLPNVGCRVADLTVEDVREVIEFRRQLEPVVAGWAAERATAEDHLELKQQWQRMDEAAKRDDVAGFFHEDLAFHKLMWRTAGNRFAMRALEMGAAPLFASGLLRGTQSGRLHLKSESQKHKQLLQEILRGNAQGASQGLLEIATEFEGHLKANASGKGSRRDGAERQKRKKGMSNE